MRRPEPNPRHCYEALQARTRVPETEQERSLYVLLHGVKVLNQVLPHRPWSSSSIIEPSVEYPFMVYTTQSVRVVLEAFLLASNDNFAVATALEMAHDEVDNYRTLFFDTRVFRTQLERIVFMSSIPDDHPHKKLYDIALRQGLGALQWHYCQKKSEVEAEDVLKTIMTDSYFRALEHRGLNATSKQAREAAKYAKISLECARTLFAKSEALDANTEQLRLKFEEVRKNRTINDLHNEVGTERIIH